MTVIFSDLMEHLQNPSSARWPAGDVCGKLRRRTAMAALPKLKAGDSICLMQLPGQSYLHSLRIAVDNLGKNGACDIGFSAGEEGVGDAFASGLNLSGKATPFTEIRFGKLPVTTVHARSWQLANLPGCPDEPLEVVATITQDTDIAGAMVLIAEYAVD